MEPLPNFDSEDEERAFWEAHDSAAFLDWSQAERLVLPKLKPSTKTISLRLPESMLNEVRSLANRLDVPYQSLIKLFLRERLDEELYRRPYASLSKRQYLINEEEQGDS